MLDGNEEGISRIVVPIVAPAIVLDFDDNGSDLANRAVHQKGSE